MNELKGKRVLIIEDDVTNLAVYAVTLRQSGAVVLQDFWQHETVSIIERHQPIDVIILDLMLHHKVTGWDVVREIQANPQLAAIPIVIVSAVDPVTAMPKARELGLAGFIGKPINVGKFPEQIAACIRGEQVWYAYESNMENLV